MLLFDVRFSDMNESISESTKQSDKESRLFKANLINVLVVQTLQILHGLRDIELVSASSGNLQPFHLRSLRIKKGPEAEWAQNSTKPFLKPKMFPVYADLFAKGGKLIKAKPPVGEMEMNGFSWAGHFLQNVERRETKQRLHLDGKNGYTLTYIGYVPYKPT